MPKTYEIGRAMPFQLQEFFNDIAELGARSVGSKTALVIERKLETSEARVIGRFGAMFDPPNGRMPPLLHPGEGQAFFKDISTDPRLKCHPIRNFYPAIKSLFISRISSENEPGQIYKHTLAVCNLPDDMWDNPDRFSNLSQVTDMCRKYMPLVAAQLLPETDSQSFEKREAPQPFAAVDNADPASRFLFETLSKKQSLHERNGFSYVALRCWRKALKQHQVDALVALKQAPPRHFIDRVAVEMVERAHVLYGAKSIKSVVPVPGGSSGMSTSLSVQLAESIATKLGAHFSPYLETEYASQPGRSHPKKSAKLAPYRLTQRPKGLTLVIDDVATSGRHLELAQQAIRGKGGTCFAMSWIGP